VRSVGLVFQGEPDFFSDPIIAFDFEANLKSSSGFDRPSVSQRPGGVTAHQFVVVIKAADERGYRRGIAPVTERDSYVA
jgi:hypothetical protein